MKQPFIHDYSEPLSLLKKVEAPPFLLTRIMQRVSHTYEQRVTPKMAWVGCLALLVIFVLNIWVISANPGKGESGNIKLHSLAFFPNNSLYE